MKEPSIVVLLPTLYRPDGLRRALSSLRETAPSVDVVVVCEKDDNNAFLICAKEYETLPVVCQDEKMGPAYAWNSGIEVVYFCDIYVLGSDDIEFKPRWIENALEVLYSELGGSGLVAFDDGGGKVERAGFATQYMMTRDFIIQHNGGVAACPHYKADFTDVEASIRARKAGKFAYSKNSHVIHHWRRVDDEGYRRADTRRGEARKIFEQRKAAGFPDDFEAIIYENTKQPTP